jgi:hypothetical protein
MNYGCVKCMENFSRVKDIVQKDIGIHPVQMEFQCSLQLYNPCPFRCDFIIEP